MKIVKWKSLFYELVEELPNSVLIKTLFLEGSEPFTVASDEVEEAVWLSPRPRPSGRGRVVGRMAGRIKKTLTKP